MKRIIWKGLLFTALMILVCDLARPQTPTHTTVYVYDQLGRLKAVINPSGETAVYTYDASGNIVSISRQLSTEVSIIEFTPDEGFHGASVTIYGTGFSATPGENTVSFNGTTASVSAASATQIITSVPVGATSGPITVSTANGTATSAIAFVVQRALSITSFTPTIGTPGTPVQITGTDFDPTPANNQLKFNITTATVSAATSTTLDTSVPAGATSGHISVTTPADTAVSTGDFFVPPSPYTAASVDFTARMALGETRLVSVNAANHVALIVFDGAVGQRISLQAANTTISSSTVRIIKPDGSNLLNPTSLSGNWFVDTLTLAVTGTYTILIDPNSTFTGTMNLTLHGVPADATATVVPGGPPVTVSTTTPGQNANVTFEGTPGQRVSLNLTNVTISSSSVNILKPDGTTLTSASNVTTTGLFFDTLTLPVAGTYSVAINPKIAAIGSMTLTLNAVPPDATGSIVIGGPHVVVTINTPGENARLTFNGTAGQIVELDWSGTLSYSSQPSITKPDGSTLEDDYGYSFNDDVYLLPATGTYTIEVNPGGSSTGTSTFALYEIPQPVTGSIEADGPPITVTIPTVGQIAKFTFNGTTGQRVSLKVNNVKIGPYFAYVEVTGPDGSYPGYVDVYREEDYDSEFFDDQNLVDTMTLPATGTYTITIYPDFSSGSLDLTLYNVPPDVTTSITPGGPPVTVTTTVPGQDGRLTFSGTVGDRISFNVTDRNYPYPYVCILNPSGFVFDNNACFYVSASRGFADTVTLPTTGTYTIRVQSYLSVPGTTTINLYTVPPIITGSLTLGGPPVTVTATVPGQDAEMTFSGTAGQRMSLKASGTLPVSSGISILRPNGQTLTPSKFIRQIGATRAELFETLVLPTTGTYKIKVDTWDGVGNITFDLYEVPADVDDGQIEIGDPPTTVTSTAARQNRQLTFQGTQGQVVHLKINNDNSWLNHVWIYRPDGLVLTRRFADAAGAKVIEAIALPASGTYRILTEFWAAGDSVTLTLAEGAPDITGTIARDGQPVIATVPASRQVARYTFNGTAGQLVGLKKTDVTMRSGVVALSGTDRECCFQSFVSTEGAARERFSVSQLTTTGENSIRVDPDFDYTGGLTLRLFDVPTDLAGTITTNGPPVNLAMSSGQNATLTFDGTTGQQVTVRVTNNTIGKLTIELTRPTGFPQSYIIGTGSFDLPVQIIPTPGTYSISINPWKENAGTVSVSVISP